MRYRQLNPLCDRIGRENVDQVVNVFYERLLDDDLVGPLFKEIIELELHKKRIADFWWIAMGGKPPVYDVHFDMVGIHEALDLEACHFERWFELMSLTLEAQLPPHLAADWLQMAKGITMRLRQSLGIN